MSRSYKKVPVVKDCVRGMKALANRIVRRKKLHMTDGSAYRKVVCSYDISDWAFRETYAEYRARAEQRRKARENGAGTWRFGRDGEDVSYWDWYKRYGRK